MTTFIDRRAARVLLVDDVGRILLLHGSDPGRAGFDYWFTPGGGLEPGESMAAAAVRELAEETGLRLAPDELGEPVWREVTEFPFDGRWYRQEQEFFLARVPSWTPDTAGFDEVERMSIDALRWWTPAELTGTTERIYPAELAAVLGSAVDGLAVDGGRAVDGGPVVDGRAVAAGGGEAC